ncbi:MAG: peptidoglycan-binding domain-containing protein [Candidatus Omnitrophica bacterium]|nr:peptidoglycan-binding domain-containing protein [Candidatus Omnitrophota bacterium]
MEVVEKPSVQDIQQALKNANLYEGNIDGVIGPNTRKAIEAFQSQSGLKADGKVGPKTWQKLKEYLVK